jgi:primosomal protein N'
MTRAAIQYIPLSSAYLCQDCSCVGNCAEQCPACASTVLLALAGVLDREEEELEPALAYGRVLAA